MVPAVPRVQRAPEGGAAGGQVHRWSGFRQSGANCAACTVLQQKAAQFLIAGRTIGISSQPEAARILFALFARFCRYFRR
jgi:hypothetical protein